MQEGFDEWRAFLERYQLQNHGFVLKHITYARQLQDQNDSWVALARQDGEIVGAMTFKISGYGEKLIADTFYTVNSTGRYQLLDLIGRHTDQVKEAIIELRPDDYPELWFRDLGARVSCGVDSGYAWPAPMGRVVDVAALQGIASGTGNITLDIEDSMCPWNDGRFTFQSEGGRLEVTRGGAEAVGCLTIQGLSALIFCGHDPADFSFRGWGDPGPEAQATLRALFPPAVPDVHEKF
jgi:predicted acetyltransferase